MVKLFFRFFDFSLFFIYFFWGGAVSPCFVNRKVIRDRLVIWALKGLFLGIIIGAILRDFTHYFWDFGLIFVIKALVSLESSGA